MLSLAADEHNRWIYDPSHIDYDTDQAKDLRERRLRAILSAPQWLIQEARFNDLMKKEKDHVSA